MGGGGGVGGGWSFPICLKACAKQIQASPGDYRPWLNQVAQLQTKISLEGENNKGTDQTFWVCRLVCTFVLDMQQIRPRGYKTWVQSQTQNKAEWLAACGHVPASSQSLRFNLCLRMNSSFITFNEVFLQQGPDILYYSFAKSANCINQCGWPTID